MIRKICIAIFLYALSWLAAYSTVMVLRGDGASLKYVFSYFIDAWSFSGGEVPSFIWLFSLGFFVMALVSWLTLFKFYRARA